MTLPNVFEICDPRTDDAQGAVGEAEFAADLARVLSGNASGEDLISVKEGE